MYGRCYCAPAGDALGDTVTPTIGGRALAASFITAHLLLRKPPSANPPKQCATVRPFNQREAPEGPVKQGPGNMGDASAAQHSNYQTRACGRRGSVKTGPDMEKTVSRVFLYRQGNLGAGIWRAGPSLVRWPDARVELRQARVARRFNMMLFGCHASFGQLGQRRGQLIYLRHCR